MAATSSYILDDYETTFRNVIDNELTTTAETRRAVDPSTGKPLFEVPVSTQQDVHRAVAAGQAAFPAWRDLSTDDRASYLLKFADAIDANRDGLGALLGKETGKPPPGVNMELFHLGNLIRMIVPLRIEEELVEETEERKVVRRYVPLGVGVGITAWNFPMGLGVVKLAAALLVGNVFIWKPSPYSPYTALKLGELATCIFPRGVLQVLSGGEDLGPMLTAHPGVAKISFTGSVATGKKVMAACAATLKRVTLELGGNDAAIVCADADLATVVPKIAFLSYVNSGQICLAIKRVYVHETIYDAFLAAFIEVVKTFKVGGSTDADAALGPVQNSMQYAKVQDLYNDVSKQGLNIAYKAELPTSTTATEGFFLPPTVVDNPPDASRIVTEEPFGPIVPLIKWSDEADVLRRANDSLLGLGGSVWSADEARAERMARQLEAGTVWVNSHFEITPNVAFGGFKESGVGVEQGTDGLKGWCNHQSVWVRKSAVAAEPFS
ncbi:NAD-dependent aldehyde dehydrogenase [Apiospora rasikravindrae]|uniref:aldehyde dehydrogenase (NAD(+)) n=1 Tax=Apiospora rasikravindrae TaxID=990691 RepID=A0ABR1SEZ5_9PEZI